MNLAFHILFSLLFNISTTFQFQFQFHPPDNIAINCGFSGNYTANDGRIWIGDSRSIYFLSKGTNRKSISLAAVKQTHSHHHVPYTYARFSKTQFTYTIPVSPGPKFVRLHFYPASYRANFQRNAGFFTVKAGQFTLLNNFSASLTADALGITTVSKEFCLNVKANRSLRITFSPSRTSSNDKVYAFVNGIEVVSMPNGLYYSKEDNTDFNFISRRTALETLYRLNIGGSAIAFPDDTGMFREWSDDSRFFLRSRALPLTTTIPIKYKELPNFVAPQSVYQTSWSLVPSRIAKENTNFTWKLPVDQGFRYLIRFHFCELDYEIKEIGQRVFRIYLDNHMAEPYGDIIKWSGEIGAATYKDYSYVIEGETMAGKRNIFISICSFSNHHDEFSIDVILKGLEIIKLSNPDNSLAAPNPRVSSKPPKGRVSLYMSAGGNKIAGIIIIILTMLNFVSWLCVLSDKDFLERKRILSQYDGLCQRFSLSKIRSATNNFNIVLGKGGFGKVYKGLIDGIEVAIKQLDTGSKQGFEEFLVEIKILTELQNPNIVTLIGYCIEGHEMILVYKYMAYGTLADHLHKLNREGNHTALLQSWEQRLKVCIGIARGLEYLHTYKDQGIIHGDIKSTNILLDENIVAKIADFGMSKMVSSNSSQTNYRYIRGTPGYLDKKYISSTPTKKSDVYAFGVVLWEIYCGRPALYKNADDPKKISLDDWAVECFIARKVDEIIDPNLRGPVSQLSLKIFKEVAHECLINELCPEMESVVTSLELAVTHYRWMKVQIQLMELFGHSSNDVT